MSGCRAQAQVIPNLSPRPILVSSFSYETDLLWLLVGAVQTALSSIAEEPNAFKYLYCNEKYLLTLWAQSTGL